MTKRVLHEQILSQEARTRKYQPGEGEKFPYAPLFLKVLMAGERLTFNLYLKAVEKGGQDIKFILFAGEDEILEQRVLDRLADLGIDRLYFHKNDLPKGIAYLNNHLQILREKGPEPTLEVLTVFKEHLNLSLQKAFKSTRLGRAIRLAESEMEDLLRIIQKDPPTALKMVWKILYQDYNLYNHSINVCLLGMSFLLFIEKTRNDCRQMGMAALFHDFGMTRITPEIMSKEETLTPEEWQEVKAHPRLGYEILRGQASIACMPEEPLRLVLEHHENLDGSGYPQGLVGEKQHPWTRFIRVIDAYDALTVNRPYRVGKPPFAALKILQKEKGPQGPKYDQETLEHFIRFLAFA
ncbi:MAG: HD domain-containing phosphohydrolase [Thermodesulfobacteriota bacterium]